MDQDQIAKLGDKMRNVYENVAEEAPAAPHAGRVTRRLRKTPGFGSSPARGHASRSDSFMVQHPLASLLLATGIGYVLSRLTHR